MAHLRLFSHQILHGIPSAWLVLVQLIILILTPLFNDSLASHALSWCLSATVLVLIGRIIKNSPIFSGIGLSLVIAGVVLSAIVVATHNTQIAMAANIVEAAAYFYGAAGLVMYMFDDHYLTRDELFAAAAVFTLFTWGFAFLYSVCQNMYPNSFNMAENQSQRTWLELLFLSFSIQSGTGLSDIVPLAPAARVLTALQMFSGVMYLAIVVSRFIGLQYVGTNAPHPPKE